MRHVYAATHIYVHVCVCVCRETGIPHHISILLIFPTLRDNIDEEVEDVRSVDCRGNVIPLQRASLVFLAVFPRPVVTWTSLYRNTCMAAITQQHHHHHCVLESGAIHHVCVYAYLHVSEKTTSISL